METCSSISMIPPEWWRVDKALRRYVPVPELDASVCHIAELPNGAAMGIRCEEDAELQLVIRDSPTESWKPVNELTADNGTVVNLRRHVFLQGDWLFATNSGTAIFPIDSGRAVEFDGSSARLRSLTELGTADKMVAVAQRRPRTKDAVRVVYNRVHENDRTYTVVDISTIHGNVEVRTGLRHAPTDIHPGGYLSHGPYYTDWATRTTRPAIRLPYNASNVLEQVFLPQLVVCRTKPVVVSVHGEVLVLDSIDRLPFLHPVGFNSRLGRVKASAVLERISVQVLDDTTFLYPSRFPGRLSVTGSYVRMPSINIAPQSARFTCGSLDHVGRQVIAGSMIARFDGVRWDTIPFPPNLRDSGVVISSMVFRGVDTIIAAARGYGVGSSVENDFRYRRGGVVLSADGGASWSIRPLPHQEQWVEHLTQGPYGALYVWATSMVLDVDNSLPTQPIPRYGTARLSRSSDGGETWHSLFVDEADDVVRRPALDHQWSISFAGTEYMAISIPSAIYVAPGIGAPFSEVLNLPFTATYGGCALDADSTLWVVGTHGLHRRSLKTTGVAADGVPRLSMRVVPNPVADVCTIKLNVPGFGTVMPDAVTLTSADGSLSLRVPRNGSVYPLDTRSLPPGAYIAYGVVGRDIVSATVVVVR